MSDLLCTWSCPCGFKCFALVFSRPYLVRSRLCYSDSLVSRRPTWLQCLWRAVVYVYSREAAGRSSGKMRRKTTVRRSSFMFSGDYPGSRRHRRTKVPYHLLNVLTSSASPSSVSHDRPQPVLHFRTLPADEYWTSSRDPVLSRGPPWTCLYWKTSMDLCWLEDLQGPCPTVDHGVQRPAPDPPVDGRPDAYRGGFAVADRRRDLHADLLQEHQADVGPVA